MLFPWISIGVCLKAPYRSQIGVFWLKCEFRKRATETAAAACGITLAQGRIRKSSGQISYSSPQLTLAQDYERKRKFRRPRFVSQLPGITFLLASLCEEHPEMQARVLILCWYKFQRLANPDDLLVQWLGDRLSQVDHCQ